jgi:hypothetical protein
VDRYIALTQGKRAVIDDQDADLAQFKWCAHKKGHPGNPIYYATRSPGTIYLHRVILERILGRPLNKNEKTDHINHDGLDNRRKNLRIASTQENAFNERIVSVPKASRYRGVTWHKRDLKWQASIVLDGERKHLGYFDNEDDAARAYDLTAKRVFLSFCNLNFKED